MNKKIVLIALVLFALVLSCGCTDFSKSAESTSGITKATTKVTKGVDGLTIEQRNIKNRLKEDNTIGSIKHLYVFSAYSGQAILYSTVDGKVTSSGKRLSPTTIAPQSRCYRFDNGCTLEVLQDDGTYGTSTPYLYWWDTKGIYHQHYVSGGQIVHISTEPINAKDVIINLETQ